MKRRAAGLSRAATENVVAMIETLIDDVAKRRWPRADVLRLLAEVRSERMTWNRMAALAHLPPERAAEVRRAVGRLDDALVLLLGEYN